MNITTIIVAGGSGTRMGSDTPKQFLLLGGMPVLMRTIEAMQQSVRNYVNNFIIVLPKSQIQQWSQLCRQYKFTTPHQIIQGGQTRFDSVKNGLSLVQEADLVLVHDGVRPFVTAQIVEPAIRAAAEYGAAIPVVEVTDSLRRVDGECSYIVDRTEYRAIQTPQIFQRQLLIDSYQQSYNPTFTDDAAVVERMGYKIKLTEGSPSNIKITTPTDLKLANETYRQN